MKEVTLDNRPHIEFEDVTCLKQTNAAILCRILDEDDDIDEDVWIPLSQVHDNSEVYEEGTEGKLIITRWIAEQKELVG
jgi:hypothetical protein